jgi:hypothetical protein
LMACVSMLGFVWIYNKIKLSIPKLHRMHHDNDTTPSCSPHKSTPLPPKNKTKQSAALLGEKAKREQTRESARRRRVETRRARLAAAWGLIQQRALRVGEPYYGGDVGGGEARRQVEALPQLEAVRFCFVWFVCLRSMWE